MIKRRFYRFEHGNRDDPSGSSSSSSDSEIVGDPADETEVEEEDEDDDEVQEEQEEGNIGPDIRVKGEASSSSGYESEDSSVNEVNLDSSGLPTTDDDVTMQNGMQNIIGSFSSGKGNTVLTTIQQSHEEDKIEFDTSNCVLKCKSVFKCKLCPKIVCLSEETINAHLISKRHARSEKLRREGRLKLMLDDNGQIEAGTDSDNSDTPLSSGREKSAKPKKKRKGPWKQWRKRSGQETNSRKARPSKAKREKRRKNNT
ncbi:hypothetical protein OROGR_007982 [Orobanche gracilis]